MLLATVLIAYAFTFGSGMLAYFTSATIFPALVEGSVA